MGKFLDDVIRECILHHGSKAKGLGKQIRYCPFDKTTASRCPHVNTRYKIVLEEYKEHYSCNYERGKNG